MRARLPSGPIAALLGSWFLVGIGGFAFLVAVAIYAFVEDGTRGVAVVTVARFLPAMFAAPFAGQLIDRVNRARLASGSCALQALAYGGTAALVLAGQSLIGILVLVGVGGVAAGLTRPALQTSMPALARSPAELTRATATWSALFNAAVLVGTGLGGLAIAAFDPGPVMAASAIAAGAAAVMAAGLPSVTAMASDDSARHEGALTGGLRALVEIPALRVPFAIFGALLVLNGTTEVQLVDLALDDLDMGLSGFGILLAVWGAGGIIGSAMLLALIRRRGYGLAMGLGALLFGVALALTGADGVPLAVVAMVPVGMGFGLVIAAAMGLVPLLADDAVAGRVYGLYELLYAATGVLGALVASALIGWLGAPGSLAAVGLAFALLAVAAWSALVRLDVGQEEASRVRELLRGVPFLRPLPLPRLERLVRNARPVLAATGETIITEGEPGEDFYAIESGTVDIVGHGRTQSDGEGFGEIALLKNIPRTTTVRALSDLRLRALSRSAFIAAITQHGDAESMAYAVVDEHLARATPADRL